MARMRKGIAYRKLERPNTRISKFRTLSYVRIDPHIKIPRFVMGEPNKKFGYTLDLISKSSVQIRQESIESARQTSSRYLEKNLAKTDFYMKIRIYPFHILRENPLAAGAGADRMSTGMQRSFGKPIGVAAQVKKGQIIFSLSVDKNSLPVARKALRRAATKVPCSCLIEETIAK
ncbi:MAG: 50S ribosomal protein L16 [Nanoarchaeota archaeon]